MLRHGSPDLLLRSACLRRTTCRRAPVYASHYPTASLAWHGVFSSRRTYVRKKGKNKHSNSGRTGLSDETDPTSPLNNGGTPMTDLEYQRSVWEANAQGSGLSESREIPSSSEITPVTKGKRGSRRTRRSDSTPIQVKTMIPQALKFTPVQEESSMKIPSLSYGLDRVLFNPGVYQIQDTRSQVFNFDPYLSTIMPVDEFDYDALKAYITSSEDTRLHEMSRKYGKKYCGSTSSMTAILSHLHYLLSGWRKPSFASLSRSLHIESTNFTKLTRAPAAAYMRYNDGVYAIDADKEFDKENILSTLGKSMEKLLTLPKEEFEKYRRSRSHLIPEEERNADECFHYTTLGDFMMRSQLDAHDPRLPGSGVFDLKTRAVISIRMDVHKYRQGQGYEIRKRFGQWESFEREYYDLIRAAFLKYSLQVRMGRMDGVFLAYHNTQRIFGFQYVSLEEMDQVLHGTSHRSLGDQEFKASVALLNDLLDHAAKRFPERSLRIHVETRDTKVPLTYFFVEPVTEEDLEQSQEEAERSLEEVQKSIMKLRDEESAAETLGSDEERLSQEATEQPSDEAEESNAATVAEEDQSDKEAWEDVMGKMENIIEGDSQDTLQVTEALHNAVEHLSLLPDATQEEKDRAVARLESALMEDLPILKNIRGTTEPENTSWASEEGEGMARVAGAETPGEQPTNAEAQGVEPVEEPLHGGGEGDVTTLEGAMKEAMTRVKLRPGDPSRELRPFERIVAELTALGRQGGTVREDPDSTAVDGGEHLAQLHDEQGTTSPQSDQKGMSESLDEPDENPAASAGDETSPSDGNKAPKELLGMYVTVINKVNRETVPRVEAPRNDSAIGQWAVEYAIKEIPDKTARRIYPEMRARRSRMLNWDDEALNRWQSGFRSRLKGMSKEGKKYRHRMEQMQKGKDVYVAWDEKPLPPEARTRGVDGDGRPPQSSGA